MKENTPEILSETLNSVPDRADEIADLSNTTATVRDMIRSGEWGKRDIDNEKKTSSRAISERNPRENFLHDFEILRRGLRSDELSSTDQKTLVRTFTHDFMGYVQDLDGPEKQQLLLTGVKILENLYDLMDIPLPEYFETLKQIAEGKVESNITMNLISLATREIRNTII